MSVAGQAHQTGDLADVLAQLLLLRLRYVFGEDLVVELTRASGRGSRRIASAFAAGPLLSPHVLLPTRAGRFERSWLVTMPGSALIPAVAYAPVVAHLLAPSTTIRPIDRSVRYWAVESARPDAGPNRTAVESPWVGRRLRWRRSLLRLLQSVLLLVLRVARRTPLRLRRYRIDDEAAHADGLGIRRVDGRAARGTVELFGRAGFPLDS